MKNDYLSQSNWDKYFSKIVNKSGDKLKNEWDLLYKIRNKVAHNKLVEKGDFEKIQNYSRSIGDKLHEAINKLSEIKLSPEQKAEFILNLKSPVKNTMPLFNMIIGWYAKNIGGGSFSFHDGLKEPDFKIVTNDKRVVLGDIKHLRKDIFIKNIDISLKRLYFSKLYDSIQDENGSFAKLHFVLIFDGPLNDEELYKLNSKIDLAPEITFVCGYILNDEIVSIEGFSPRISN